MQWMDEDMQPTAEEVAEAHRVRPPSSFLTVDQLTQYEGQAIAILLDGEDKGEVIAQAPLNVDNPNEHRRSIKNTVQSSVYRGRHYQLMQILNSATEGEI
jgi:hypothetical protein